jgi:speckle-type POZ protein
MRCVSCQDEYDADDAGTCKECYEEANETEEELKREIEDLKAKVAFLRFWSPLDHHNHRTCGPCFTDVVLVAFSDEPSAGPPVPVPAHKALLVSNPFPTFQWLRAIFFFFWHLIDMNVPWNTHLSFYFWFVG